MGTDHSTKYMQQNTCIIMKVKTYHAVGSGGQALRLHRQVTRSEATTRLNYGRNLNWVSIFFHNLPLLALQTLLPAVKSSFISYN